MAALAFALLLTTLTLDRSHNSVETMAILIGVSLPLSTAAYLLRIFSRKTGHRVSRELFGVTASVIELVGLALTLSAVYWGLRYLSDLAASLYARISGFILLFIVIATWVDNAFHQRRVIRQQQRRRQRTAQRETTALKT